MGTKDPSDWMDERGGIWQCQEMPVIAGQDGKTLHESSSYKDCRDYGLMHFKPGVDFVVKRKEEK